MKKVIIGLVVAGALAVGICSLCCPPDCCEGKKECTAKKNNKQEASVYQMK